MERRLWITSYEQSFYPNLYVFLVGPPASGKTVALIEARKLWKLVPDLHISPTSMTGASLADGLDAAKRRIVQPNKLPAYFEFNSLIIASPELSTLMPGYDGELMNRLTDIYDCGPYEETRRTAKTTITIQNSQLNLLAATTPGFLSDLMPQGAWDQGFISRVIMIFSSERIIKPLFQIRPSTLKLYNDLLADLKTLSTVVGEFKWEPAAATAMETWHAAGGPPAPEHPKLQHYTSRRTGHLLKLCMVASASRGNDLRITAEDYSLALDWLIEAEFFMPDIFKAMVTGGDAASIDETYHFVWQLFAKEKRPVAEHRIIHFLQSRVPAHSIGKVLEMMVRGALLEAVAVENGRVTYKPVPRSMV